MPKTAENFRALCTGAWGLGYRMDHPRVSSGGGDPPVKSSLCHSMTRMLPASHPAGEKGTGRSGKPLHFKGSTFHRVIPGFMCQGGDFTAGALP